MDKTKASTLLNKWTGGHEFLYCTRVYFNARCWGGHWIIQEFIINLVFYMVYREKQHVRKQYLWERRNKCHAQNAREM